MQLTKEIIISHRRYTGCRRTGMKEYLFETKLGTFVGYGKNKKEAMLCAEPLWMPFRFPYALSLN